MIDNTVASAAPRQDLGLCSSVKSWPSLKEARNERSAVIALEYKFESKSKLVLIIFAWHFVLMASHWRREVAA